MLEPTSADLKFEVFNASCPPPTLLNEGTNTDALLTKCEINMPPWAMAKRQDGLLSPTLRTNQNTVTVCFILNTCGFSDEA